MMGGASTRQSEQAQEGEQLLRGLRGVRTGKVEQAQEAQQLLRGLLAGEQDEGGGLRQAGHLQHFRLVVVEAVALRQVQAEQESPLPGNPRVSGFRGQGSEFRMNYHR